MDKVASFTEQERSELFAETAAMMGTTNAIVEKDFWVVWTLDKIFSHQRLSQILKFKGGTSLSKVYHLIGRFSEDIDLILDWREVTGEDPYAMRSKNKQNRFNEKINAQAQTYTEQELLPMVGALLVPYCQCSIDDENRYAINIRYPSAFSDRYLRPEILLEIGPLASWLPSETGKITSFSAEQFPDIFEKTFCMVDAIVAHRTFWEKATILHHEANRPERSPMPPRYSRHYYDLSMMAQTTVKDDALEDMGLLEKVVDFKQKFYPRSWAKYEEAKPGTFRLLPPKERYGELKSDYTSMREMIFDKYLAFDEMMEILQRLEDEINEHN